jgi:filamentous hemagglutinin family protein
MSSLNHVFRLVWSERIGAYVAVPESGRGRGKGKCADVLRAAVTALGLAGIAAHAAGPLPSGAQVAHGAAQISQSGNTMTVDQATSRLVTNWQSFDIAPGHTVQFVQPSAASVALNRVVGSDVSTIQGALKANGQVFLVNPNGILFSPTARLDVGGLVASTLPINDADFLAGRYHFEGDSAASITNAGALSAAPGGTVALFAARIVNTGTIDTPQGQALLASGSSVTLDVGGSAQLQVDRGVLDGLIDNGGAIRADGGRVLLTARALDALSRSVVNQSGLVRARTLASGEKGEIVLLGDMAHGSLSVGGTLDASAPAGGDGGFIETSAAHVDTAALTVNAGAARGQGGQWLIDPYDYTITSSAASTIAGALNTGTNVTVTTQSNSASYGATGSGSGDITVSSAITKSSGGNANLTLRADRNIIVNSAITATTGQLGITLSAANNASSALGGVAVNANLASNGGKIMIGGAGGNATATQANGIGFALNTSSSAPAVKLGTNASISSGGGDIVINGYTTATTASYDGTKGGVYVLSGATVDSGGGNILLTATSAGDAKEFAFGVEGNSGTVTTFRTSSTGGAIVVDVNNTANVLGSLGLVNNGNQARIQFWAPSVAHMLFRLNGNNQAAQFTQSPPCNPGYPNCGTMVIPGGNSSYTSAGYNVVSSAMYPIYVSTGSASRTYDGSTATTGLPTPTSLGGPGGFTVANLGSLTFSTPSKNAGSYTSLVSSPSNPSSYQSGTYAVAYFNQGTYTITPKTLNSFSATDKTYDGTTAAAVTSSGLVNGDAVTLNATGSFGQASVGNGVAVNITGVSLAGADAGNYTLGAFGSINTTANITPAPLSVTATAASKAYDGLAYSGGNGVSYSGFVNGETASVLSGSLSYAGSAQGAVNAGSYAITPQGLSSSNYAVGFNSGTLTVSPATLTMTANAATHTYGSANPTLSGSVGGFVGTDTLGSATTGSLVFSTAATSASHVGSYAVNGSGLTANSGNYVLAQAPSNASALTVTPASLLVTAANASKTYNGLAYSGGNGVSYSGFVNGETASVLSGSLSYVGSAQGAVNAGSHTITPQGLSGSDYTVAFNSGTLTVAPAALTVTAANASKSYDALAYSGGNGVSYSGFVNGETAAVLSGSLGYTGSAQGAVNAGSYALTPQGLSSSNYTVGFNSGTLTVSPATLTLTANAASRSYGAANPTFTGSVSGLQGSDTLGSATTGSLVFSTAATSASHVGSYAVNGSGLTANSGNYVLAQAPSNTSALTVTPAALNVTAANASKTYDGLAYSGGNGVSYSGFVNGETASVLSGSLGYSGSAQGAVNAGSHAITPQGLSSSDYTVAFNSGTLTVAPATLTLTANAASRTYGAANPALSGNATGFVGSDTLANATTGTLGFATTATSTSGIGSYAVAGSGLSANHGNYVFAQAPSNGTALTITPAALLVTANNTSKLYDGQAYSGGNGVSYSGFVNGENAGVLSGSLSYGGSAQGAVNTGSYSLLPQGLTASNYSLSFAPGTLSITPASLSVITGALTGSTAKVYDGTTLATLVPGNYLLSGFVAGEGANVTKTTGSYADANAGSGKLVTVSLSPGDFAATGSTNLANYSLPGSVSGSIGTITPAPLVLGATAASKTYDGNTSAAGTPLVIGLMGTDSITGLAQAFTDKNAGSGKTVTVTPGWTLNDGAGGANYSVSTSSSQAGSVAPATLTVSAGPIQQVQGGAPVALTGTVGGFVAGETQQSATTGTLVFTSTATLGSTPGSYAINGSGLTALQGNYVFAQAPANAQALTVTPAPATNVDTLVKPPAPVPNFPDNARPALGTEQATPSGGSLNYVALMPQSGPVGGFAAAPAFRAEPLAATLAMPTVPGASADGGGVLIPAMPMTSAARPTADGSTPAAEGASGAPLAKRDATRAAAQGSASVAVSSANGPLDVFVIDGGINVNQRSGQPAR